MDNFNEDIQKMYSGFYRSNGKIVMGNMDDIAPMSWSDAVESGDDFVGRLRDSVVMLDVDSADQAQAMLKIVNQNDVQCNVIQTSRGRMHFYFLNGFENNKYQCDIAKSTRLFVGIDVDIKMGSKYGFSPIKVDGEFREVSRWVSILKPVPYYFLPDYKGAKKYKLFGLKSNDGRNETLFRYIGHMQNQGFDKSEIIRTYRLINDYVLGDPLDRNEFETVLREDAFFESLQSDFFEGRTFKHNQFGDFLQKKYKIVKLDGNPQIYIDDKYTDKPEKFHRMMIHHIPTLRESQRKEVMEYLKKSPTIQVVNEADPRYLLLQNGVYDTMNSKIVPWKEGMIFKNQINCSFDPSAHADIVDKFMFDFTCGDHEVEQLIWEAIGYTMYRRCPLKTIFFLYGPRADNGKSTFLDMLQEFIGEENISNVPLQEMADKFERINIYGKLANMVDDVALSRIKSTSMLKSASDGRRVKGEYKGVQSVSFRPYATFWTSGNTVPKSDDKTAGWTNRLCIIPSNAYFPKGDPRRDPDMGIKLSTDVSRSYIFNKSAEGLKRALVNKMFTKPDIVTNEIEAYHIGNNTVLRFFAETCDHNKSLIDRDGTKWLLKMTAREFKRAYDVWCEDEGISSKANARQIKEELIGLGYRTGEKMKVEGSWGRYFTKM